VIRALAIVALIGATARAEPPPISVLVAPGAMSS
jgi:hypothetical protein